VLSVWSRYWPEDGFVVTTLSRTGGLVQCAKGLVVQAEHSYADVPPLDVLVYPGGQGTRPQLTDEHQLDWVRRQKADVPLLTSVCTGSLVFAAAGLLAHRPATTHWRSLDQLAELDPTIDVRRDARFVATTATSSPRQVFRLVSTWPCTSSFGWRARTGPGRCAAPSSTTRLRRCSRHQQATSR